MAVNTKAVITEGAEENIEADVAAVSRIPVIGQMLEVICRTTGMGFAAVARVTAKRWVACCVRDEINFGLERGGELELETTICHEIMQSGRSVIIDNVSEDDLFANHHTPALYGFQSYISIPIVLKNGEFSGTLCAIDPKPAKLDTPETIGMFKLFADLISFHLNAAEELRLSEILLKEEREMSVLRKEFSKVLSETNDKLMAVNEKLTAANNTLTLAQADLKQKNIEIEQAETKLRLAIDSSNIGTWYINPQTRQFIPSLLLKEIYGFLPDETMTYEDGFMQIREDYRDEVSKAIKNAVIKKESYNMEYPVIRRNDNKLRWVLATGKHYYDEKDGKASYLSGTMMDITEQVTARQAIAESEARYRQAIESGNLATWSLNPFTYKLIISNRFREIMGLPLEGEVSVQEFLNQIDPGHVHLVRDSLRLAMEQRKTSDVEYPVTRKDTGERRWVRATGKMFYDADDKPVDYSGMLMDVTERKLDDIRKNDFIGMVSHELKTPLTSLGAYVQLLQSRSKNTGDEFTLTALDKVNSQVKKMGSMINGFLNISRLESGKIFLEKQDFDLQELLTEMVEDISLITVTHTITQLTTKPLIINADRDKIGSVISNLLSNAVKYSPKGKLIQVACEVKNDKAQVSIKDEGMGIKPKDIGKLFDRYYRVESDHTRHISGFGIGLYLSAEIVHRHGGEIWVESESGKGSTFFFSLVI